MNVQELWRVVLAEIELSISKPNFLTWFKNTSAFEKRDSILIVQVPNNFIQEWLRAHYEHTLLKLLRQHDSEIKDIQFAVGKEPRKTATIASHQRPPLTLISSPLPELQLPFRDTVDKITNLNPRYHLDGFVVGPSNELAYTAAKAITENPGTLYNPLFIYGGVGLGKTHLLQAVGNMVIGKYPSKTVRYLSSENFVNDFISAIRNRTTEQFKERYRSVDVLLIDDIQFIGGKEISQEELFHTFNDLQTHSRQIVFTSDRPPKSIPTLEDRLRSRFEGGMIVDIGYPEFETRIAFLKQKAKERNFEVTDRVFTAIGNLIQRNIRELEGALIRIAAEARTQPVDMDEYRIKKILMQTLNASRKVSPKQILKVVAEFYEIDERVLLQKSRRQEIVYPRQIAMYLLREELQYSYPSIGARLGGRDHTTVIHACDKIARQITNQHPICEDLIVIRDKLRSI